MVKINPYINFPGTAEEALGFYKSVFGGEIPMRMRFKDLPPGTQEMSKPEPEDADKMMHIALMLPSGVVIMATDYTKSMMADYKPGNNHFLSISVDSKEEADNVFAGLSVGAGFTQPMKTEFWGDYFGMLTDRYGVRWMINYSAAMQEKQ